MGKLDQARIAQGFFQGFYGQLGNSIEEIACFTLGPAAVGIQPQTNAWCQLGAYLFQATYFLMQFLPADFQFEEGKSLALVLQRIFPAGRSRHGVCQDLVAGGVVEQFAQGQFGVLTVQIQGGGFQCITGGRVGMALPLQFRQQCLGAVPGSAGKLLD